MALYVNGRGLNAYTDYYYAYTMHNYAEASAP